MSQNLFDHLALMALDERDDFWEEVEVAFADDFLPLRQIDGLQELRDIGHFFEKFCR